jgi:hypothetical protein
MGHRTVAREQFTIGFYRQGILRSYPNDDVLPVVEGEEIAIEST